MNDLVLANQAAGWRRLKALVLERFLTSNAHASVLSEWYSSSTEVAASLSGSNADRLRFDQCQPS